VDDQRADDAVEMARAGVHALAERAPEEARQVAADEVRRWWPRIIISNAVVVALVVLVFGYFLVRVNATDTVVSTLQQAQQAKTAGDKANGELASRGQPQVPIPTPGTAPDTDVIVASAAARVLASLPVSPTRTEISAQIAREIAGQPVPAPPISAIAAVIAGYFETNPVPAGPQGERGETGQKGDKGDPGEPGHTPTAEEIQADLAQYLADHPEALCPRGGSIAQLRVQLSDGGTADTWTCVVATYPAPTTTSALPIPTT
jgi:hypothetical protein